MLLVCFSKSKPVLGLELHQRHVLPIHVCGTRHFQKRYCNCMDWKAVFSYIYFLRWNQPLLLSVVSTTHVASKNLKVAHHPPFPLVAPLMCNKNPLSIRLCMTLCNKSFPMQQFLLLFLDFLCLLSLNPLPPQNLNFFRFSCHCTLRSTYPVPHLKYYIQHNAS